MQLGKVIVNGQRTSVGAGQVSTQNQLGVLGDRGVFDTPFSVSAYTDQLIRDQQARNLGDVLDNDPSVRTSSSRYAESGYFAIRGFPVYSGDVLFAGLPGMVDYREAALDGIARVDVFKGPSALINNGATDTSVGGTINFVPKRAADAPLNRVTFGYDSDAEGEAHLDVGRRYGAGQAFGVRANLGGRYGDTPVDHQDERAGTATLGLDYRGQGLRTSLDVIYQTRRLLANESGFTVDPGFAIPKAPDASSNLFDKSSYFKNYDTIGVGQVEYDLLDALTVFAAYGHRRSAERYKGPYSPEITGANGATNVFVIPYAIDDNADAARLGVRAQFATGPLHHQLTLSADGYWDLIEGGFNFKDTLQTNLYHPVPLAPEVTDYPDPINNYRSSTRRSSLALVDAVSLFEGRLSVIAGARRQAIAARSSDPATGAEQSAYSRFKATPSGAVLFKLTPRWSVYGNYSEALQTGPSAPISVSNPSQVFAPQVARQIEGGTKYDFGRGGATVALFRITEPFGITDPATNVYSADGEQRNRGVEATVFGTLGWGVRLIGGGSYIDPVQVRTGDPATEGKAAVGTPRVTLNLGSEWDLPFLHGLTATARGIYTSKQNLDADASRQIPGWGRLDLGARYAFAAAREMTLRADVQNVTGGDYWASAQQGRLAIGAPRTVLVSLSSDF